MPLVTVRYNPAKLGFITDPVEEGLRWADTNKQLNDFTTQLPEIVARALHVEEIPDAHLNARDVTVFANQAQVGDINRYALDISILANDYIQRSRDQDRRRHQIARDLQVLLAICFPRAESFEVCVYLVLVPGSFEDFVL